MVADPKDLAMGANLPAQVGDPVTKPVSNYRAGMPGGAAAAGGASGASASGTSASGAASGTGSSAPSAAGPS